MQLITCSSNSASSAIYGEHSLQLTVASLSKLAVQFDQVLDVVGCGYQLVVD